MKLLQGFDDPAVYQGGYVSIGNFDGVHRGHQSMTAELVRLAQTHAVPAVVLTFEPHPITLLRPGQAPPSLSTLQRKAQLLGKHGVDCVIAYPTDQTLLDLSPDEFFQQIIQQQLDARGLVEGPNFFFGKDRAGDVSTLKSLCLAAGMTLNIIKPVRVKERMVSSSVIRSLIADGRMTEAVQLLGHPYQIIGRVAQGEVRGRTLGFPTANLEEVQTLLPADGVYAGIAHHECNAYPAAVNLGPNPTFGEDRRKLEVHLIGFDGDLYGQLLKVDFLERLRETQPFASVDELRIQLDADVQQARALAKQAGCD